MKKGGVKGDARRCWEKQDKRAVLRKGYQATWQRVDKKYGLI